MDKVKIRKVSDWWGEPVPGRGMPKYIHWLPEDTQDPYTLTVYVDHWIKDVGFGDPSREKIGWLVETPQLLEDTIKYLVDNLEMTREHYKFIFTCLDNLLELGPPFTYNTSLPTTPWILEKNRMIYPKTKLVSMIASNKDWLRGHQNRLQWVEKLRDKVDLFGRGRPNQLNYKEDGLRDYMFSVTIENDNTDTFFTEKLADNFVTGTVPIYWGSRKVVEKYFDPTGVIFLEDDPDLSTLTPEKYQSMMPAIERNFKIAIEIGTSEDYMWENYLKNLF